MKASFPDAPPVTLQSKFNPYHRGRTANGAGEDFLTASAELGVVVTAYCPLNDWPSKMKAVDDAHVRHIAGRLGKTAAQVILRWAVQLGLNPLTRSRQEERLRQAAQIWDFELSDDDMARLSGLAWFVLSPSNKVPATVVDAYGVRSADAAVAQHAPRERPTVAQPIKACDMAWSMLDSSKMEL
uniref:NADP-dependent oxidoreductase domain-containing protein n=1 Tax=Calcidiscus leptoporus TaxID=127549 RepID=A0A7S0JHQ2_9EUKA